MCKLYLVKPDLLHFDAYNDMMREWCESGGSITPWFLDAPCELAAFAALVKELDACEKGTHDDIYAASSSFFLMDENHNLLGATSLRHYLTEDGYSRWGHIGYGIRPSERNRGLGTKALQMMLEEAKKHHLDRVLLGAYVSNTASCRVIEKCGGRLLRVSRVDKEPEEIKQYIIDLF